MTASHAPSPLARHAGLALACLLLAAPLRAGECEAGLLTFAPAPVSFPVPGAPVDLAVADFDGNQLNDLAVSRGGAAGVALLMQTAPGVYAAPDVIALGPAAARSIAAADLNGDGRPDLAFLSGGSLLVLLNDPITGFPRNAPSGVFPSGGGARGISVGDLDLDGDRDLAVADLVAVLVYRNDGSGVFAFSAFGLGGRSPSWVQIGHYIDVSSTFRDLAVATTSGSVVLFEGNGTDMFVERASLTVGTAVFQAKNADLDCDSDTDLVVTARRADGRPALVALLNNNLASFALGDTEPFGLAGDAVDALAIADLDGDNFPDAGHRRSKRMAPGKPAVLGCHG